MASAGLCFLLIPGLVLVLALLTLALMSARRQAAGAAREAARCREALLRTEGLLRTTSHELRTPLSVIQAYTQLLIDSRARGEASCNEDHLVRMERATRRMQRLVSDLLDMARAEAGALSVSPRPCDLGALCRQVAEEQEAAWGREVCLDVPDEPVWVRADPGRMAQVLGNLLGNAIAYSQPDRPVWLQISARGGAGEVVAQVRDEGPGIEPAQRERLFESGCRVEGAGGPPRGAASAGLGLGLPLCKVLVQRHGGRIWVESEPGRGSTFFVALPVLEGAAG
jgi:signal transduction histidine kinase